jgi:hypothetical protein
MPQKLRPVRKRRKKRKLWLRPKLPQLRQNQKKVRPAMPMRKMQGSRIQAALRSRTAQPALQLQVGARRIRRTRKIIISDTVFESTQHSIRQEGHAHQLVLITHTHLGFEVRKVEQ